MKTFEATGDAKRKVAAVNATSPLKVLVKVGEDLQLIAAKV